MNLCLEKRCRNGFAYHPLYPVQVDFSGSFRYFFTLSFCFKLMDKTRSFAYLYAFIEARLALTITLENSIFYLNLLKAI